jgi:hypothetical protein
MLMEMELLIIEQAQEFNQVQEWLWEDLDMVLQDMVLQDMVPQDMVPQDIDIKL